MKISIVTPSYNRPDYLYETAFSILTQQGDFDLEYIIQDGGSKNEVINLIKRIERDLSIGRIPQRCRSVEFRWYSEKDNGMYDAITRGFANSTGEIMAWLNSDDMYHPFALKTITRVFGEFRDVGWITGIPNSFNCDGARAGFDYLPFCYSQFFIELGYYRLDLAEYGFNWIQQESTFWRRELWEKSKKLNLTYRYAADFFLWRDFARYSKLTKVFSFLGGYRFHGNQITGNPELYNAELGDFKTPPEGLKRLNLLLSKFEFQKERVLWSFDSEVILQDEFGLQRHELIGDYIFWNFSKKCWEKRNSTIFDRNYFTPC
ncbi:glycosyltransferase [Desulfobacter postgatei]|nr:glycosyltransferase [Desulfobacter postgatei]